MSVELEIATLLSNTIYLIYTILLTDIHLSVEVAVFQLFVVAMNEHMNAFSHPRDSHDDEKFEE